MGLLLIDNYGLTYIKNPFAQVIRSNECPTSTIQLTSIHKYVCNGDFKYTIQIYIVTSVYKHIQLKLNCPEC